MLDQGWRQVEGLRAIRGAVNAVVLKPVAMAAIIWLVSIGGAMVASNSLNDGWRFPTVAAFLLIIQLNALSSVFVVRELPGRRGSTAAPGDRRGARPVGPALRCRATCRG